MSTFWVKENGDVEIICVKVHFLLIYQSIYPVIPIWLPIYQSIHLCLGVSRNHIGQICVANVTCNKAPVTHTRASPRLRDVMGKKKH